MKKLYRDLSPEARASYGITEDGSEESWVYCLTCGRAVPQGDCVVGEDGRLNALTETAGRLPPPTLPRIFVRGTHWRRNRGCRRPLARKAGVGQTLSVAGCRLVVSVAFPWILQD